MIKKVIKLITLDIFEIIKIFIGVSFYLFCAWVLGSWIFFLASNEDLISMDARHIVFFPISASLFKLLVILPVYFYVKNKVDQAKLK
jgi:hypothetical protein